MKIGIDAKWFYRGPASGRVVTRNLVKHLVEFDHPDTLVFFLDRKDAREEFPFRQPNVQVQYVWADNNLVSNMLVVPQLGARLGLDAILYQNFPGNSCRFASVSFIHDCLFLSHPRFYTRTERLYFAALKPSARRATRICTVSQEEKMRLLRYRYKDDASDIDIAYHGVDESFMPREAYANDRLASIRKKYGLPEEFVLFVGRLNDRKNIANIIRALHCMRNKNIPLVIVGRKDWKFDDVSQLVEPLGLRERVVWVGPIHGVELAIVYALATVFCFPSFAESFGLPALEAMASGVPAVVSDRTSLPEICGSAGNYVDPSRPDAIASMIDALLEDSTLYQEKRNAGILRSKFFTWKKSAEAVYESLKNAYDQRVRGS